MHGRLELLRNVQDARFQGFGMYCIRASLIVTSLCIVKLILSFNVKITTPKRRW